MKHNFFVHDNKIYCVTTYKGKTIKSVSKCHPEDEYSFEDGMDLAEARCDVKVSERRLTLAIENMQKADAEYKKAKELRDRAWNHLQNSITAKDEAVKRLTELEKVMK